MVVYKNAVIKSLSLLKVGVIAIGEAHVKKAKYALAINVSAFAQTIMQQLLTLNAFVKLRAQCVQLILYAVMSKMHVF